MVQSLSMKSFEQALSDCSKNERYKALIIAADELYYDTLYQSVLRRYTAGALSDATCFSWSPSELIISYKHKSELRIRRSYPHQGNRYHTVLFDQIAFREWSIDPAVDDIIDYPNEADLEDDVINESNDSTELNNFLSKFKIVS